MGAAPTATTAASPLPSVASTPTSATSEIPSLRHLRGRGLHKRAKVGSVRVRSSLACFFGLSDLGGVGERLGVGEGDQLLEKVVATVNLRWRGAAYPSRSALCDRTHFLSFWPLPSSFILIPHPLPFLSRRVTLLSRFKHVCGELETI